MPAATTPGSAAVSAHVVDDPAKSVFYKPFERFPATMPGRQAEPRPRPNGGREARAI
jgi:hypothetical protein